MYDGEEMDTGNEEMVTDGFWDPHPHFSVTARQNIEVMKKFGTSASGYYINFKDMEKAEDPLSVVEKG